MSSADEELRELERQVRREPASVAYAQKLAVEYHRRGQLRNAIQTLLDINQFNEMNPCAQLIGVDLKKIQHNSLILMRGLYHYCGYFDVLEPVQWRFIQSGDAATESFLDPVLGLGNLSDRDCEQLFQDSQAPLWLHSLSLEARQPNIDLLTWLVSLPFLQSLEIGFYNYSSTHDQLIGECRTLRHLKLDCYWGGGFPEILENDEFTSSLIRMSYSGDLPLRSIDLRGMERAQYLQLDVENNSEIPIRLHLPETLEVLILDADSILGKETVESFSRLRRLRSLSIECDDELEFDGSILTALENLESLSVRGPDVRLCLRQIPNPKRLKSLTFHIAEPAEVCEILTDFESLEELRLGLPAEHWLGNAPTEEENNLFRSRILEVLPKLKPDDFSFFVDYL